MPSEINNFDNGSDPITESPSSPHSSFRELHHSINASRILKPIVKYLDCKDMERPQIAALEQESAKTQTIGYYQAHAIANPINIATQPVASYHQLHSADSVASAENQPQLYGYGNRPTTEHESSSYPASYQTESHYPIASHLDIGHIGHALTKRPDTLMHYRPIMYHTTIETVPKTVVYLNAEEASGSHRYPHSLSQPYLHQSEEISDHDSFPDFGLSHHHYKR